MDNSDDVCIMKSTQNGISEFLIVYASAELYQGRSVFYVLPNHELMYRFVSNRWEKSYLYSDFYKSMMKNSKQGYRKAESKSLKDVGQGVVSFAGSQAEAPFAEFPADVVIIDEKDLCDQDHVAMARERLDHSDIRRMIQVANPTVTNYGIHIDYQESDQKSWFIKCSSCGKYIKPDFFKHIVREIDKGVYILRNKEGNLESERDIMPICHHCNNPFDRFANGEHVPKFLNKRKSGYQISKLYSGTSRIQELVKNFNAGLVNDFKMERFYNADLGLPYVSAGAKITKQMLDEAKQNYTMPDKLTKPCIMGVDVGGVLHVRIDEVYKATADETNTRAVFIGEVHELNDLFTLCKRYNVKAAVIDALPETRLSKAFSTSLPFAFRCFFGNERKDTVDIQSKIVTVNRTQALDNVKEAYILGTAKLPKNADSIKDYYDQMQASTRIFDEKKNRYIWDEGSAADHYMLAECYMRIAHKLLLMAN